LVINVLLSCKTGESKLVQSCLLLVQQSIFPLQSLSLIVNNTVPILPESRNLIRVILSVENKKKRQENKTTLKRVSIFYKNVYKRLFHSICHGRQEGRAVTGNHRTIPGSCTESLHLILRQRPIFSNIFCISYAISAYISVFFLSPVFYCVFLCTSLRVL